MLSKSQIYKIVYEYLAVTESFEGIDKLLNNWIVTDPSKPASNIGTVSLINLCAMLREDMKTESNKANGKANIEKAMKSIIKSAIKLQPHRESTHGAFINNNMQCVCDGYRMIRIHNPIELPAVENALDVPRIYEGSSTASEELVLPEMAELKALIKVGVAEKKQNMGEKQMNIAYLIVLEKGSRLSMLSI